MLEDALARLRFGRDQQMVGGTEEDGIGQYAALRIEEERVKPLPRLQAFYVIRRHRVQQPLAILARGANAPAH